MYRNTRKRVALVLLGLIVASSTIVAQQNYDFKVGQLYYKITDATNRKVAVVPENSDYPYYNNAPTGAITIPAMVAYGGNTYSVTCIGGSAFTDCTGLTSITIPNSVTRIDSSTFFYCSGLTSITIPNSVTSIGNSAFSYCSGLTSISIPSSVTYIGGLAFSGCSGLTSIYIPSGVTKIENGTFKNCPSLTSVNLPSGLDSIGSNNYYYYTGGVFENCTSLTSITIPNSVTSIGRYAFSGCSGLTSIDIPSGVTKIENGTFKNCTSLTSVNLPSGLDAIGSNNYYHSSGVFVGCTSLTSISIPNSVTSIGRYAFSGCSGLDSISVHWQTPLQVDQSVLDGVTLGNVKLIVPFGKKNVYKTALVWKDFSPIVERAPINYIVSYNQSAGGTFTLKNGSQYVISGSSVIEGAVLTIEATPDQGYKLDGVKVNGTRISGLSFTVDSNSTVEAYFSKMKYTVTYTQFANGTLTVRNGLQTVHSGGSVEYGTVLTVEATPYQGYKLDSIRVNGARISGLSFTVDSNSMVEAYFSKMKYTITYTQPANGTLAVKNGSQTIHSGDLVEYGTVLTIEATPYQGYKFDSIRVNGTRIEGLSFTVTGNTNIEVFFGKQSYTVTYNSNMYSGKIEVTRGSEIVASGSSVEYGTQLMVRAIPNPGFEVKSLTINDQAIVNNFVFSISEAVEIKAVFAPATTALDEAAAKPLALYPNPVAEVLYLSATARTIRIYDMYGTEVAHATDTDKVEVSYLPAGVYTVRADGSIAKMIKR